MFPYNFILFFSFIQKLFQIWILEKKFEKKKKNKLEKKKANLFLET